MTAPEWRTGPPPSLGWWPASVRRNPLSLRWWNGSHWSNTAMRHDPLCDVEMYARTPAFTTKVIEWCDRPKDWPPQSYT